MRGEEDAITDAKDTTAGYLNQARTIAGAKKQAGDYLTGVGNKSFNAERQQESITVVTFETCREKGCVICQCPEGC